MITDLSNYLAQTVNYGGSDLHLSVGMPPVIRIEGSIKKIAGGALSKDNLSDIAKEILPEYAEDIKNKRDVDAAIDVQGVGRFRVNLYHDIQGLCLAFRHIPGKIKSFEDLGLPNIAKKIVGMKRGMVLVTGVTGSGKSTTLASIIDRINQDRTEHIITIEQPVEFVYGQGKSLIHQREVGVNVSSFAQALRSALREDPDVIMVGELRDLETISMAISAAETGHLIFGTLHTKDAPQTVSRIIDVFPPSQQDQIRMQLAGILKVVISQVLAPSPDGTKRYLACEVMVVNNAIRRLIRDNKIYQIKYSIQSGLGLGMHTLEESIKKLISENKIAIRDVYHWLYDEGIFEET